MIPEGPIPARVMIVGEAPGEWEERTGRPFQGPSGQELNRMLEEAGLHRSQCFVTNVCRLRPPGNEIAKWIAQSKKAIGPEHVQWEGWWVLPAIRDGAALLQKEIEMVNPEVIIALGNVALYALTEREGIGNWRGSILNYGKAVVIPTWHPAYVMRMWGKRAETVQDLRRAAQALEKRPTPPHWRFEIRPTFEQVMERLYWLEGRLSQTVLWIDFDLETRAGHIACAGLSWSLEDALCIPFMSVANQEGYWPKEQEFEIIKTLRRLLTHPNILVRGQNLLYDCQYTHRDWGFLPRVGQDTAITFHTAFPELRKALDYQASMLCDYYVYWKEDGKIWDGKVPEDELWGYNCTDCVRTREVGEKSQDIVNSMGLADVDARQQKLFAPVLFSMMRGVRVEEAEKNRLSIVMEREIMDRKAWLVRVLGHSLNPASSPQMKALFYEDFALPVVMKMRQDGGPTPSLDDEALESLVVKHPLLKPLVTKIQELRTISVYKSTFVDMPLDVDHRMRCSYRIDGTETYRFNSKENAFDSGGNLQNLPKGNEDEERGLLLPNIRSLYVPDPGYTIFDIDGKGADFQVLIAEADDENLYRVQREVSDIHTYHLKELGLPLTGWAHGPRDRAKRFTHATNYVGNPRGLATKLNLTVRQAEYSQNRYFQMYPGVKKWQERVQQKLITDRFVENKLGYRRFFFGRVDDKAHREACAWIPQSTVACVINQVWLNIWETYGPSGIVEVLLQVHDSLMGQFLTDQQAAILPALETLGRVVVPYPKPLIIPMSIKTSMVSWGACG